MEDCTKAIQLNPQDASRYVERGHIRNLLDSAAALRDYETAVQLEPDNATHHKTLASFYGNGATTPYRDFEKAIRHATRAIELAPNDAWSYLHLSMALHNSGRTKELSRILELLDRALEIEPSFVFALVNRARALSALAGKHELALADCNRAAELSPHDHIVYFERARIYTRLGEFDKAFDDAARAQDLAPASHMPIFVRAETLASKGDVLPAIAEYGRVIERRPKWVTPYHLRADLHVQIGNSQAAADDFTSAISLIPVKQLTTYQHRYWYRTCADCYRDLGMYEQAAMDLQKIFAMGFAPNFSECYQRYSAALLYLQMGENEKYRESVHAMQQRFATTEHSNSQHFVGWTACLVPDALEDYSTVLALAEKAVTTDPENDQYQKTLAATRFRAGEHDAARELLLKIAQRDENPDAKANSSPAYGWYFLAMTQQALGNTEDAETYLAKANDWTNGILSDEANPPAWNRRLTLELLRDEATQFITPSDDNQPIAVEATSASEVDEEE